MTTNAVTKYYAMAGGRVAMRQGSAVSFLYGDHLPFQGASRGSTSLIANAAGAVVAETRYLPYGQAYWQWGATRTDFGFTGQRLDGFGLMDYNARYYDPLLGRFISPDTIIPQPGSPLAWDRYSNTNNNPISFTSPSGHCFNIVKCANDTDHSDDDWLDDAVGNNANDESLLNGLPDPLSQLQNNIGSNQNQESQCSPTSPCISPWEQPDWRDTNPEHPDYYVLSVSYGEAVGITINGIIYRYGNYYFGFGPSVDKSITILSGSLNGGWVGSLLDEEMPDPGNIDSFITGWSLNGLVGAVGDAAINWSFPDQLSYEFGGVLPVSAGISVTYTFKILNGSTIFEGKK